MLDIVRPDPDIAGAALQGLCSDRKTLPPKLFYDVRGMALFDQITALPEYYLTRTERSLLQRVAPDVALLMTDGSALVEYGACDEGKAVLLMDAAGDRVAAYVPIDVAAEALEGLAERLGESRPDLKVLPVCADFLQPLRLPAAVARLAKFGFFPGSTIGNLEPAAAQAFLSSARRVLGAGAWMIVGVDLRKSPDVLIPAYDDAHGVTAAFNLNLLHRLNRQAGADFDLSQFSHRAVWNDLESRVEMHLVSRSRQKVTVAGVPIRIAAGETIHTESSYKYSSEGFASLARTAGWDASRVWTDDGGLFSIHALRADQELAPAG
jgi:dimethylhistidine N-methyltransferase